MRYAEWRPLAQRRLDDSPFFLPAAFITVVALGYALGGCFTLTLAGAATGSVARIRTRRRLERLRDFPAPIDQIPVRLRLARLHEYAQDEGLVSLVDGWLVFEGRRTSFSLPNAAVEPFSEEFGFQFEGPGGAFYAALEPTQKAELADAWAAWQESPSPSGAMVLPPTKPLATWGPAANRMGAAVGAAFAAFAAYDLAARGWWAPATVVAVVSALIVLVVLARANGAAEEFRRLAKGLPAARRHGIMGAEDPMDYVRRRIAWARRRWRRKISPALERTRRRPPRGEKP